MTADTTRAQLVEEAKRLLQKAIDAHEPIFNSEMRPNALERRNAIEAKQAARAAIDRLAADQASAQGWISVETQRPPERTDVLVASESWDSTRVLRYAKHPFERFTDNSHGRWYWSPEHMHWQPLPAPPALRNIPADSAAGDGVGEAL